MQIRCKVAGVCDVGQCRFYLCEDADDDIQTVLDAKTCKDAVDAADEALQEAKEKRLKREKQLRKEERIRLEKDAREAAHAADAAMEAELGVLYLRSLGVCGGFTPSTRVVSRREGDGWFLFRF